MRHGPGHRPGGLGPRGMHHHRHHMHPRMHRPLMRPYRPFWRPFWRPLWFGPFFGGPMLLWWLFIPFMMMGCMLLARLMLFAG